MAAKKKAEAEAELWDSRIVGTGEEDPGQLLANPENWRIHPAAQRSALAGVLDRIGWIQNIVVNKTTGHVIDGHLRVDLAVQLGETRVPVIYVELTEDEERLALAALDPIAGMAVPDSEKLAELAQALDLADNEPLALCLGNLTGMNFVAFTLPDPVGGFSEDLLNNRSKGRMNRNDSSTEVVAIGRFIGSAPKDLTEKVQTRLEEFEESSDAAFWVCTMVLDG